MTAHALHRAQWFAAQGCSVIPLDHPAETTQADETRIGKSPIGPWKCYQQARATDAELLRWFGNGHLRNIGLVTGAISGIVVVDCDSREAIAWADAHLPPTPWRSRTAKGEHRFYRHPGVAIGNKVRINTPDPAIKIDIRGDGGYVVAPGSQHRTGTMYEWIDGPPPAACELPLFDPTWIGSASPRDAGSPADLIATDLTADARMWQAREWLRRQPPAVEGSGGDQHTFIVCCGVLRDHDLTPEQALDVLRDWNAKCEPPWSERELKAKLQNAEQYGQGPRGSKLQPEIVIRAGAVTSIVDRVESALLTTGKIYQRGGVLTRAIRFNTHTSGAANNVRRQTGSVMLTGIQEPWLLEQMGRSLRWISYAKAAPGAPPQPIRKDPPAIYARTLLGRGEWRFPALRSVVTAPILACDGRIIQRRGFDLGSGLLLDFAEGAFAEIPLNPTQDEARAALERFRRPLRGFPFVNAASCSVAVSAMLTALVRPSLRTAPLHGFDAPTAGTGKSLLAEGAGLIASGYRPPALSQGKTAEEDEKRLSTVLFAGDAVIHIDNCERPIAGDFLCSMLTQETVQARVLGQSERRILPSTALVLASGNNLTFAGDTSRRAVICRLDAQVERPDTREFDFDFHAELERDRAELVVAGLTVLRAYHVAGRPSKLKPMGSFNDWEWIRGALVWLGEADPADTRSEILDNDPRKNDLVDVMDLWAASLGTESIEVSEIDRRASKFADGPADIGKRESIVELRDKLIEVCCRGAWSGRSVGWWLSGHKDRVVGKRCFTCDRNDSGHRWSLKTELELARE